VIAGLVTGWPAGTVLAALAAWSAPSVLGGDKDAAGAVARIEAIAGWTEMLRDTTGAAAGLEQAIAATAPLAPEAIRPQVTELAGRLAGGERLDGALREFADRVADPLADLVVAALIHAAAHHARRLSELLSSLAASARSQASMRLRVDAGRASLRTSARMITSVTAVMAAGLVLLNRGYLAPYDSVAGQLILLLTGGIFAAGFTLLRQMARHQQPARILAAAARPAAPPQPASGWRPGATAGTVPGTGE
jgi:Flp pilus assembly protein TadB